MIEYLVEIPVRYKNVDAKAMIGTSWPVSMVSPEFAQRVNLRKIDDVSPFTDKIHLSNIKTEGRAQVSLETGGFKIDLLVYICPLRTDFLLGLDALPQLRTVVRVGAAEYPMKLPDRFSVTRLTNRLETRLDPRSEVYVHYTLYPSCLVCEKHNPTVTMNFYKHGHEQCRPPVVTCINKETNTDISQNYPPSETYVDATTQSEETTIDYLHNSPVDTPPPLDHSPSTPSLSPLPHPLIDLSASPQPVAEIGADERVSNGDSSDESLPPQLTSLTQQQRPGQNKKGKQLRKQRLSPSNISLSPPPLSPLPRNLLGSPTSTPPPPPTTQKGKAMRGRLSPVSQNRFDHLMNQIHEICRPFTGIPEDYIIDDKESTDDIPLAKRIRRIRELEKKSTKHFDEATAGPSRLQTVPHPIEPLHVLQDTAQQKMREWIRHLTYADRLPTELAVAGMSLLCREEGLTSPKPPSDDAGPSKP